MNKTTSPDAPPHPHHQPQPPKKFPLLWKQATLNQLDRVGTEMRALVRLLEEADVLDREGIQFADFEGALRSVRRLVERL